MAKVLKKLQTLVQCSLCFDIFYIFAMKTYQKV